MSHRWIGLNGFQLEVSDEASILTVVQGGRYGCEVFSLSHGCLRGMFLEPSKHYVVILNSGVTIDITTVDLSHCIKTTVASQLMLSYDMPVSFINAIIENSPEEYFFTYDRSVEFWHTLLSLGLFVLDGPEYVLIPNPKQRFCFDLFQKPIKWRVNIKWMIDFDFHAIPDDTEELRASLCLCRDIHSRRSGSSSWITQLFIDNICSMVNQYKDLQFIVFKVVEKRSGQTAAVSIGYRYKNSFMDFTACTVIRDKRSAGKLVMVAEAQYLQDHSISLWYLGFKLPYMDSLSRDSLSLQRRDFQCRWIKDSPQD